MTKQTEKTATTRKLVREEGERRQRASAPTLRDLQTTPAAALANAQAAANHRPENARAAQSS